MKKVSVLLFALFFSITAFGQLSGEIVKDSRKLTTNNGYVLQGKEDGRIVFAIAVDDKGDITSAKVLGNETTVDNVQEQINTRHYVMTSFKFEPGTWFPKFHQGKIAITLVKPKESLNDEE